MGPLKGLSLLLYSLINQYRLSCHCCNARGRFTGCFLSQHLWVLTNVVDVVVRLEIDGSVSRLCQLYQILVQILMKYCVQQVHVKS